jgi:putative hemolysin
VSVTDVWAIVAILLCTLFNFFFSLAETALVSVRSSRLQHIVQGAVDTETAAGAEAIQRLLAQPTRIVATVQIGLTVLSLTAAAISVAVLAPDLARLFRSWHIEHDVRLAVIVLVAIVSLLTLVVGELVPRAVALRHPERTALLAAVPLLWLERIERVLVVIVLFLSNLLVRPFGLTASFNAPVITEEELKTLLEASQKQGVIEEEEKEMLRNVISFGDTVVHEVMTPRIDIKAAEVSTPASRVVNLIVDCGHSRIPIYEGTVDNIIGLVHAKDLLPALMRGTKNINLRSLMRKPYFVPENKPLDELLEELRHSSLQIAIVQDEYGGTAGLVTIEDLLEEIVGEIKDEYDTEEQTIVSEADDIFVVDAKLNIDDLNEELDLRIPAEDFDTIGGFVFGLLGRLPREGDNAVYEDLEFTVLKADNRRAQKIRIAPRSKPAPEAVSAAEEASG